MKQLLYLAAATHTQLCSAASSPDSTTRYITADPFIATVQLPILGVHWRGYLQISLKQTHLLPRHATACVKQLVTCAAGTSHSGADMLLQAL